MSSVKKKHHYIPQLLIRNFSQNGKHIHIYNHTLKKIYTQGIDTAFAEQDLNLIVDTMGNKHPNLLEDFFEENFESKIGVVLKKIRENIVADTLIPPHLLSSEDWFNILQFALATEMRNPYELKNTTYAMLVNLHGNFLIKQLFENGKFDTSILFAYKRQNLIVNLFEKFNEALELCKDLKIRILYHTYEDEYLLLPDKGVIMLFDKMKLSDACLQILLPISSKAILLFCRDKEADFLARKMSKSEILKFNALVVQNFYEFIGCEDRNYLSTFIKNTNNIIKPKKIYPDFISKPDLKRLRKIILSKKQKIKDAGRYITHIDGNMNFNIYTKYYKDAEGFTNLID